jgi:FtsP/CotA-like multicopper oxidase with cupredoxin domain
LNQVSAGMAGIITIGNVGDYVCNDPGCAKYAKTIGVRHITLKDTQILADGTLLDEEDPDFCLLSVAPTGSLGQGFCPGQDQTAGGGNNYTNGRWFFTLNGQQFPSISVAAAGGEIWRITNASGSVTYDLELWNPAQNQNMIVQVLSVDGVSISPNPGAPQQSLAQILGNKASPLPCPGVEPASGSAPTDDPDAFGLGYEELDEHDVPVPGSFMDVKAFDPMRPTVCLPLGSGNTPVTERWELVNLAGEDHNFHIHQVRFRVLSSAELDQTKVPSQIFPKGILIVPLVHADGGCLSVADWRKGACKAHPAIVAIPFAIAGDFVYHCHILEHQGGGMMARIRVRPNHR